MKKIVLSFFLLFSVPAFAGFTEGVDYFDNQQYAQSFAEFKPLADDGDERAQYYVAYMYLNGLGIARDEKMGINFLQESASQNFEKALSLLGYLHSVGKGVKLDKKKALQLYQEAAKLNDNEALLNLGIMYYTSDGVAQDTEKAIEYFQRVDLVSTPIVGRYLADIYQVSDDEKLRKSSKDLYLLAASNGDLGSFHSLATMYQTGTNETKNTEKALEYYTYAASQGYAPSQYHLGILYANGTDVEKDIKTAYAWITLAANQGFKSAVETQKELEDTLTFSELNQARNYVSKIQQTILGKVESPLKDFSLKNIEKNVKAQSKRNQNSRRRPASRRGSK